MSKEKYKPGHRFYGLTEKEIELEHEYDRLDDLGQWERDYEHNKKNKSFWHW